VRPAAPPRRVLFFATLIAAGSLAAPAWAQDISINFGQGGGLTERVLQLIALMTVLSLAPSILVMVTSFTRIVVVLSLLRTALGTATAPPNTVIISLALFLTAFVMGPAFERAYDLGVKPLVNNEITAEQAFERASDPFRAFMLKNVREKDLKLFVDMSREAAPARPDELSLRLLVPAFMHLFGGLNWWAPRPLLRLRQRIVADDSEGSETRRDFPQGFSPRRFSIRHVKTSWTDSLEGNK